MYECLRLRSRDISAYVVDGDFSFAALEAAGAAAAPEVWVGAPSRCSALHLPAAP